VAQWQQNLQLALQRALQVLLRRMNVEIPILRDPGRYWEMALQ
jgi:hypothetical protein